MLITLSDLKDAIGETTTDYDTFLTNQINLFSSAIENYCSRKFELTSYTQTFYYSDYIENIDRRKLWLFHYPVTQIDEVREITTFNGVDNTEIIPPANYRVKGNYGRIEKTVDGYPELWFKDDNYFLVSGLNSRVEIDYTAGFATTPYEIQEVITTLIEERYLKKKTGIQVNFGSDVQRISIPGTMSLDFDYSLQANERKTRFGMLLGNYVNVLDYFRSERSLVGEIKENYVS